MAASRRPRTPRLGSALTHPWITTDYSEALLEFITPPLAGPWKCWFLRDLEQFVYTKIDKELLWCSSMPCVVEGEESIPIAQWRFQCGLHENGLPARTGSSLRSRHAGYRRRALQLFLCG
jgi:gamma-glutamylcysteine synthetase